MSSPLAFAINSVRDFELTDDGQYLTLKCNGSDRIDLHCSVMHELLAALSNAIGSSERIRHKKKNVKFAMPCEAWALGKDAGGAPYLIFTFRLPGGAELSFQLHRSQAAHLTEVLALATGFAMPDVSGVRLQ
ncbi:hypothetical protein [Paraburkholderia xenovorans]|uniref:hypothetical protein n=1 Tax=Paraburkholderia xenovorans TaxID=36873 RepID=UPI0038BA7843